MMTISITDLKDILEHSKRNGSIALVPSKDVEDIVELPLKPAAVLMPLVERTNEAGAQLNVLLTRRAQHLTNHAGQISFPGGRRDDSDPSLLHTALRETEEETGILASHIEVLGELPQHHTITRFEITPYVGLIPADYQLTLDANEVEEAFEVPLHFLCDPRNQKLESAVFKGKQRYFYSIKYKHYNIWGATARIIVEFAKRLQ